jgi:anti-anti-sigma factor
MAPLSVTLVPTDPGIGRVTLIGEHDAYSAAHLEDELAVLRDSGLGVVVDLSEATFVDSQTLSVLLSARHDAEDARLGFVLALPPQDYTQVHRILDMTGLQTAFAIEPDVESAVASARAGRSTAVHARVA